MPKPRSEKDRARALEVDEDITRHVPLSDRYIRFIYKLSYKKVIVILVLDRVWLRSKVDGDSE